MIIFRGYKFYVYLPIIRTIDNLDTTSSPGDFEYKILYCMYEHLVDLTKLLSD